MSPTLMATQLPSPQPKRNLTLASEDNLLGLAVHLKDGVIESKKCGNLKWEIKDVLTGEPKKPMSAT